MLPLLALYGEERYKTSKYISSILSSGDNYFWWNKAGKKKREGAEDTLGRVNRESFPEKLAFEWGINEMMEQATAFWIVKHNVNFLSC